MAARRLPRAALQNLSSAPISDIFVRRKPIDKQPLGRNPNLIDGVRLNIRPFVEANILREKPGIKWDMDRGSNPPGATWSAERDNDRCLALAEKCEAREKAGGAT